MIALFSNLTFIQLFMENSGSGFKIPFPEAFKEHPMEENANTETPEENKDISGPSTILSERQRHVLVGLIGLCIVCLMSYLLLMLLNILKE